MTETFCFICGQSITENQTICGFCECDISRNNAEMDRDMELETIIEKFKYILFVGEPEILEKELHGMDINFNIQSNTYFKDLEQELLKIFSHKTYYATTQRYEIIKAFYNAALASKKLKNIAVVRVVPNYEGEILYVVYDSEMIAIGLANNMEIR